MPTEKEQQDEIREVIQTMREIRKRDYLGWIGD